MSIHFNTFLFYLSYNPDEFVMTPLLGFTNHYICWIYTVAVGMPQTIYSTWGKQQYGLRLRKFVRTVDANSEYPTC